ncbi:C-C chemokine receptor type 5-like isoform X2 [Gadus morhua]|uniref:C-C chemokine receptor type 5-like isoform X2 n=1 Tax=Gadus morhua TaxID=8049 RepID=UPI0011B6D20A|nr:C-C chemokine receptor type 5-like isoform X2 [Gadus morhua]
MGDEQSYEYDEKKYLEMFNSENTSDVVIGLVQHCSTSHVNQFGSAIIPYFYYINFLLSYLGNWLVLFIIVKLEKVNSVTNIFLINLVTSNILFASSFPFLAKYHSSQWIFGTVLCKLVSSAHLIGFYSSILFLTLMTFDRYLAVVHAVSAAKSRKRAYAIGASLIVWFISVLASLNELVFKGVWKDSNQGLMCEETGYPADVVKQWKLVSYYMRFLLFFLLPLFMVMYCYTCITVRIMSTRMREKWRSVKLIFIIMFTFFVCWTPYNIVILLKAIQISTADEANPMCVQVEALNFAVMTRRPSGGGRLRLFTQQQELSIVDLVRANSAIRLNQLQQQILADREVFKSKERVSISTIRRILVKHQTTIKQLYRVPFQRNSVRVKGLRREYVQEHLGDGWSCTAS